MLDSEIDGHATHWVAARDLLNSAGDSPRFVVETERDGSAVCASATASTAAGRWRARRSARATAPATASPATSGRTRSSTRSPPTRASRRVRNPLPARGGTEPESFEQVRRRAPQAFRTQERAVTPADYEAVTMRDPAVQRAAATLRWTGSWNTVFITVDRFGGRSLTGEVEQDLARHVDRYRMAGHDLEFDDPRFVSLELELFICVDARHFRSDVRRRLLDVLSGRDLPDGTRGLFHPDRFSFGQTIYLSPILAAARDVAGVESADVVAFHRQGSPDTALPGRRPHAARPARDRAPGQRPELPGARRAPARPAGRTS